jgi:hypothetical protein
MEKHAVKGPQEAIESLDANRAMVRGLLLPRSAGAVEPDVFPRSQVMRFLLDTRKRRLAYGVFTAAWMLMGRRKRRRNWF